jgi:hypothetical protein
MPITAPLGMIPIVRGGLGNQLFAVSAAYVASRLKDCPMYILDPPPLWSKHVKNGHKYEYELFKSFGTIVPGTFLMEDYARHALPSAFHPWDPNTTSPGTVFDDYYQYYPAIQEFEQEIRTLLLEQLPPPPIAIESESSAFLHIRRGDYKNLPNFHFLQPIAYYKKALELLQAASPQIKKVYVFSDEIEWAKQQPFFQDPLFSLVDIPDEVEALSAMAACKAGAICANSTFSWWGAFLGSYSQRRTVIVPSNRRWVRQQIFELHPPEWIQLDYEEDTLLS